MSKKGICITTFMLANILLSLYAYGVVKNLDRESKVKIVKYDYGYSYDVKINDKG